MPVSWKYGSSSAAGSRRGSTDASASGSSNGVSAIYAAASGLYPAPIERKIAASGPERVSRRKNQSSLATTTQFLSSWQPQRLGKFDRPIVLRASCALPELLEGVFERNRALAAGTTRPSGSQRSWSM